MNRNETKMIQGLSVLAMICLHLFNTNDFQGLFTPLIFVGGIPLSFYLSQISDFCVMGFAFSSGYGHYKSFSSKDYYKKSLTRLLFLYINYWIILFLFSAVSMIMGQASSMPGDAVTFIKSFFTLTWSYNGTWWYLPVYAVIVLISPLVLKISQKVKPVILLGALTVIYCFSYMLRFKWCTGIEIIDWFGPFGMTLAEYLIGVLCCKICFFEKLKDFCGKINKWILYPVFAIIFIGMLWFRVFMVRSLAIAPITGFAVFCIFIAVKKPGVVEKFFVFISKHSTNIWLVHMFFYLGLFNNLVYKAKYPILVYIFMIALCLAVSYIVMFILNPIKKRIQKLIDSKE